MRFLPWLSLVVSVLHFGLAVMYVTSGRWWVAALYMGYAVAWLVVARVQVGTERLRRDTQDARKVQKQLVGTYPPKRLHGES